MECFITILVILTLVTLGLLYSFYSKTKDKEEKKVPVKNNSKLREIIHKIKDIDPIVSTLEFTESNESYTLNKKYVHLCLKDQNGNDYDDNMLVYVALHEVAHALSKEVIENKNNHTKSFFTIPQIY